MRPTDFFFIFFFLNDTAPTEIYPLPLHAPLPIFGRAARAPNPPATARACCHASRASGCHSPFPPTARESFRVPPSPFAVVSRERVHQARDGVLGRLDLHAQAELPRSGGSHRPDDRRREAARPGPGAAELAHAVAHGRGGPERDPVA